MEIIVVDNASSDDSVKEVRRHFPQVKVIVNDANLGFAKGNNVGLNVSNGRYVCLANTDTLALDGAIDKSVAYMDENPSIGAMIPKNLDGKRKIRRCAREFPTLRNTFCEAVFLDKLFPGIRLFRGRSLPLSSFEATRKVDSIPCSFMFVPRQALREVGLLDERFFIYGEDIDWCKRFHDAGWDVVYFADASVVHFGGESSRVASSKFLIERIHSELLYWKKHKGLLHEFLYRLILISHYTLRTMMSLVLYLTRSKSRDTAAQNMKAYFASVIFLITGKGARIKPSSES
jgi:GT2 family glycosyltransferase